MFLAEVRRLAGFFLVHQEADVTLLVAGDVLGLVLGDSGEAEALKQRLDFFRFRARILDELKAVGAQRVLKQIGHGGAPLNQS